VARRRSQPEPPPDLPTYTVDLDAESFAWLHEMLRAKLKYNYLPGYLALVRKTLISFDDAERRVDGPRRRMVPRTVAKPKRRR
jgi:hypothetical protein